MCNPGLGHNPEEGYCKGNYWNKWWNLGMDYKLVNSFLSTISLSILVTHMGVI
jgi:hypothetical protein